MMAAFLEYLLKVSICMTAFYLCYRLLLNKESFHRLNRTVLLLTAFLSFILPFCVITVVREVSVTEMPLPVVLSDAVADASETVDPVMSWQWLLTGIIAAGAVFFILRFAVSVQRTRKMIAGGLDVTEEFCDMIPSETSVRVVVVSEDIVPFSWMDTVVLSLDDYGMRNPALLLHECAHIRFRHSWDVVLTEIFTALNWFNPVMWMLKSDLRAVHEYEADDYVLSNGVRLEEYQNLLIKKAVSLSGYSVANSFNHSILKNRITMMSKKSNRRAMYKALYVIPLVGVSLAATANVRTVSVPVSNPSQLSVSDTVACKNNLTLRDNKISEKTIYLLDGKEVTREEIEKLKVEQIASMRIRKDTVPAVMYVCTMNEDAGPDLKVIIKGDDSDNTFSLDNVQYMIDGKTATKEQAKAVDKEKIIKIVLDKKNNAFNIITKE